MSWKQKIGQKLIKRGLKLVGDAPQSDPGASVTDIKEALEEPTDAVVHVSDRPSVWSPEQHGNVIVAEPKMISLERKGKLRL
jgi:hypothetical protein